LHYHDAAVGGPTDPIVADVVRDGVVESVHLLDAVVVDAAGSVIDSAGDPERVAYFRSSLKPVQAAVCIEQGWEPRDDAQIAIACASHNAEPAHLEAVRSILDSAGVGEDALRCPPALPLLASVAARAGKPARILRDCSGKHAAFLAACIASGRPIETYLDPAHPLQIAIIERVRELAGEIVAVGVDGCGAPTPATTLARIATAFGRGIARTPRVHYAMRRHPFLVAGSERVDTAVMEQTPSDLVLKGGAEGLMCFASPAAGVAGAIKARDGGARGVAPATIAVLARAGLTAGANPATLARFAEPPVLGGGEPRGSVRIRGASR